MPLQQEKQRGFRFHWLIAALALLLGACGGGGSSAPPNAVPIASFSATPASGIAALTVNFNGSASSDSDGTLVSYQWNFGDGNSASGSSASHTYTSAGSYTATLTVTDDKGGSGNASRVISVAANTPPAAIINADKVEGIAPLTVAFNGTRSTDADGTLAAYAWVLGNGQTSPLASPTALYNTPGEYTVQLTVTDDKGASATTNTTVYVAAAGDTFTLAGAVSLPDTAFTDCDTGDTAFLGTPAGCNQSSATAQRIQSPAVVGGFAAFTDANPGDGINTVDALDHYGVSLAGGETLSLTIADSSAGNNLDLKLFDASGTTLIAQSANSNTAIERLVVPAAGDYIVQVSAVSGRSNYVLSIGTATASVPDAGEMLVDGEFIAHFSQLRIPWRVDAQGEARSRELAMDVTGGDANTPMLLRDRSRRQELRRGLDGQMRATLRRLRAHPDLAWVEPNRLRQSLALNATDTHYPLQWNLPLARFPGAWDIDTLRGSGTRVAVLDTGILAGHPDLAGRLVDGYDFISDATNAGDGNGFDSNPADPGGDGIGRSTFHGTHVAGIVAANTLFSAAGGNSGIAGAAPGAMVMPLRVVGRYGATSFDVIQAIRYAAGLSNDSFTLPSTRADVINLSIGSTGYSQAEQDAISAARAAGVIVVAAGGNSGTGSLIYPAAYAGVVGVGAVTPDRRRAPYSNTGSHIDIVAPGGDKTADLDGNGYPDGILSTLANDSSGSVVFGYDFYQGTSMAAPHVAAVAAMMKAVLPTLTPALFDSLLASGALTRDLGAGGRDDEFGNGLLDAEKALVATGVVTASPALAVASPTRISLGAISTQALVVVDNGGGGSLSVTGSSSNQPWLTVSAQSVDGNGLGSYLVSISRATLVNGSYGGSITFNTTAGSLQVPVNMVVDASVPVASVGTLYIVVWDPKAQNFVNFTGSTTVTPGSNTFSISAVADQHATKNGYQFYVGTDNDLDGYICDPGEACGAWTSLQEPQRFVHARNRTDLSFNVGYASALSTLSLNAVPYPLPPGGIPRR